MTSRLDDLLTILMLARGRLDEELASQPRESGKRPQAPSRGDDGNDLAGGSILGCDSTYEHLDLARGHIGAAITFIEKAGEALSRFPVVAATASDQNEREAAADPPAAATIVEPEPIAAATDAEHDATSSPLTHIRDIDVELAARLTRAGVHSPADIARWRAVDVARIAADLGLGRRISKENWIEQAALLVAREGARLHVDVTPPAATHEQSPLASPVCYLSSVERQSIATNGPASDLDTGEPEEEPTLPAEAMPPTSAPSLGADRTADASPTPEAKTGEPTRPGFDRLQDRETLLERLDYIAASFATASAANLPGPRPPTASDTSGTSDVPSTGTPAPRQPERQAPRRANSEPTPAHGRDTGPDDSLEAMPGQPSLPHPTAPERRSEPVCEGAATTAADAAPCLVQPREPDQPPEAGRAPEPEPERTPELDPDPGLTRFLERRRAAKIRRGGSASSEQRFAAPDPGHAEAEVSIRIPRAVPPSEPAATLEFIEALDPGGPVRDGPLTDLPVNEPSRRNLAFAEEARVEIVRRRPATKPRYDWLEGGSASDGAQSSTDKRPGHLKDE